MDHRVLIIAGSDSSGGAGLEADQRVLTAHGVYSLTATTALTAQNTQGVHDVHVIPGGFVRKQVEAALGDVGAAAVKIGMLACAETIDVLADTLPHFTASLPCGVALDPVMVSTSGAVLLPPEAVSRLRTRLLPLTTLLTPNIPEAKLLLEDAGDGDGEGRVQNPVGVQGMIDLAYRVRRLGARAVLLKGGHLPLDKAGSSSSKGGGGPGPMVVVDVLVDGQEEPVLFETDYQYSADTHGTGCSLTSAVAANLALGKDLVRAVRSAVRFVEAGIRTCKVSLGKGSGPINHFHSFYVMPFAPGRFLEYLLDRPNVSSAWQRFIEHEFVWGLGTGMLPVERFKQYLVQDYLYLTYFARSNALAAYKGKSMDSIVASAQIVLHIKREMSLHLDYCSSFGLSKQDLESAQETQACTAYSRYILDIGQSDDWLALQTALAPCLLGYGEIARRLHDETRTRRGNENRYWRWIENYVADDYVQAVRIGSELLEEHVSKVSPSKLEELVAVFVRATELEIGFWDMGMAF